MASRADHGASIDKDLKVVEAAQTRSGAILACPDYPTYRYSWLRDGAFCAVALDAGGASGRSRRFHRWVAARVLASERAMRSAMEAVAGGAARGPDDYLACRFTADGVAPRGDGWGAFQMDGPGLWLWALERHACATADGLESKIRSAASLAAEYVSILWAQPSYDAWEEHEDRLASSTLAGCLAGLVAARRLDLVPPEMRSAEEGIRAELEARAARVGYLPRSHVDDAVDASILWCGPLLGVFGADDPVWVSTLARVESELVGPGGGVYRYAADTFYGGGQWPLLTAAYGLACLDRGMPGDREQAAAAGAWVEAQRDEADRLPEQSSRYALSPDRTPAWLERWGPVAKPLSWSHAMAALLRMRLESERPPA